MKNNLNQLLENYLWTFDGEEYSSQHIFEDALKSYMQDLDSVAPEPSKIQFKEIMISLEYVDEEDEDHEIHFILNADNHECFTEIELLYKINNKVTKVLADLDKHFFEGLSLMEANSPPLYSLDLGS